MNIVLATDNNFVQHCCVTLTSILYNNNDVDLYIITDGLTVENERLLESQTKKMNGKFHLALVDKSIISKFPMPKTGLNEHISLATYYRLFVAEILPVTIEKIIYLDCDMVIVGSLEDFWKIDINNKPIAAVYQHNTWATLNNVYERLNIPYGTGYFNAGSLLINLKYWRDYNIQDKLLKYMFDNYNRIVYHDQDILNGYFYKSVIPISNIWNCRYPMIEDYYGADYIDKTSIFKIYERKVIIHYVARPKPWEYACNHPFRNEYYKYLDMTSYFGWRPKFQWANFKRYKINHYISRIYHFFISK